MFLTALLDGIMTGLKEDKQVKIKGLGTFALKAVAARKSVNIATGESFTIEGYNKLNFAAESTLKECVEKRTLFILCMNYECFLAERAISTWDGR